MNKAKKLLMLFEGPVSNQEDGIEQAIANAKYFNRSYYVNSTTSGLSVDREPIKNVGAGTRTLFMVSPEGEVKEYSKSE